MGAVTNILDGWFTFTDVNAFLPPFCKDFRTLAVLRAYKIDEALFHH
jgi:hypothetical protein